MTLTRILLAGACAALVSPAVSAQEKPGASEQAERRIAALVQPPATIDGAGLRTRPIAWPGPRTLERPTLPPPAYRGDPPRLALVPRQPARPRSMAEGTPLAHYLAAPTPPAPVELPTEPLIRLPSADVREPLPLPILATPQKDRASLADPTLEASVAAALQPQTPARTQPVPFAPLNLPDPFENVATGRLRVVPDEDAIGPVVPHRTPNR